MSNTYLGLDVSSSSTGWCILTKNDNEKKLSEYGLIKPEGSMGVTQRLYFFGNELKKLIDKFNPDEIAVEETILVRGPKIMRTLSRFSGVALFLAYSYQKKEIATYEPSLWKKSLGLKGGAKKPQIQLKICESFSLIDLNKINDYQNQLNKIEEDAKNIKVTIGNIVKTAEKEYNQAQKQFDKFKKEFKKKKKKEKTEEDDKKLSELENKQEETKGIYKAQNKEHKNALKEIDKRYEKISVDIYSDSGINADIADSVGVVLKLVDEKH